MWNRLLDYLALNNYVDLEGNTPKYLSGVGAVSELPEEFEKKKLMGCWNCETELIWGGDHDIDEEFDHEDAHQIENLVVRATLDEFPGGTPESKTRVPLQPDTLDN